MKSVIKIFFSITFTVLFLIVLIIWNSGLAQEKFPSRPVQLIVSWSAGGGQDLNARTIQPQAERNLGQPLVVVNKPGGGAVIGFSEIANARPDGYTIGIASPSLLITQYTVPGSIDYHRYEPIIFIGFAPESLGVKADAPWKTLRDFLDYAKANPGKIKVSNSGHASITHLVATAIEFAAGAKFIHVPYKGSAPSMTALLGGHVDALVTSVNDNLDLVKGGKMRILGVTSPERSFVAPSAPTFKELGMDLDFSTYYSVVGPKGISRDRIKIIHDAFKKAMESKEYETFSKQQGITIRYRGPEEFAKFLEAEDKEWKRLVGITGLEPAK